MHCKGLERSSVAVGAVDVGRGIDACFPYAMSDAAVAIQRWIKSWNGPSLIPTKVQEEDGDVYRVHAIVRRGSEP